MRASNRLVRWRWLVLVTMFAMVAAACQSGGGETTTTAAAVVRKPLPRRLLVVRRPLPRPLRGSTEGFTYRLGIFQDTTTDNFWAYLDPAGTVWNQYVLSPTKPALYKINYPGLELDADVAASAEVPTGAAEGDGWAIEVPMREDAVWSDGEPPSRPTTSSSPMRPCVTLRLVVPGWRPIRWPMRRTRTPWV